jgi:hypothetical protein
MLARSLRGLRIPLSSAVGTARAYAVPSGAGSGSFGRRRFLGQGASAIVSFLVE